MTISTARSVVGRDTARQLFDGPPQHFDGDLRHFRRRVLVAIRREQRQQEIRQQQRHHDHAGGDERSVRRASGSSRRPRLCTGIVNINDSVMVPFGPAERHDGGAIASAAPSSLRRLPVVVSRASRSISEIHRKPHGDHHGGDGQNRAHQQQPIADAWIVPAGRSSRSATACPSRMNTVPFERKRQHSPYAGR